MRLALYYVTQWVSRIIAGLLAIRLVLRFFSANPVAPAVAWLYDLTAWLLQPVDFIFPNVAVGTGVFDMVALIGLVFYAIIFAVILRILRALLHGPGSII
jgi:YggT family protein